MFTIFSKITENRKREYQIETKIVKDTDQLFVLKKGIYNNKHVLNMLNSYELLSRYYENNIVKCEKYHDYVKFPYISGVSLEELMNQGEINKALNIYSKIISMKENIISFNLTDEYKYYFGDINYSGPAFKIPNIDLSFSNIIVNNDNYYIIDYEWVVDFPIPKDLIVYRALIEYFNKNNNSQITLEKCMDILKVKYDSQFDNCLNHFTNVVENTNIPKAKEHYILNAINDSHNEIKRLNEHINQISSWGQSLDKENQNKDLIINDANNRIEELSLWGQSLDKEINKRDNVINEKNDTIINLNNDIESKNQVIETLNVKLTDLNKDIINKRNEIDVLSSKIHALNQEITAKNAEISIKNTKLNDKNKTIETLNIKLKNLTETSQNYENELNNIKGSTTYKLSLKYFKVRDFFFPKNSKRRLFAKVMLKAIRHPIWFIKHLTPKNIKKFFRYSKSEGGERALERLDAYKENNTMIKNNFELELFEMKPRDEYPILTLPECKRPLVSIIVPVYNQFSYTYGCIESIIKNTKEIDYEVIIGDDCSNDETINIDKYVKNIKINRNKVNTRFLLNCKNAVKKAKGTYLLFLNNDTNVQWNWLKSLLDTMEHYPNAGMVGSKLVYPNGQLQEAGGILWNDGSAWNYGNKSDPTLSEYNYRKPVDYISGAAIMISRKLWDEIGGFDETFCPAYCEDSDLAFEVRKHGYEVVYDPFSVVVHYEGISNGTDVTQGVKKYQVENSEKFYNKWKDTLTNHFTNAENVFLARERAYNKKTILMIDHYVPQYDKDAGSRTVFGYLKLLCEMGFNVKFIGENFYRHEPYTKELQKLGVEVLYGPYYANHWKDWLKLNGSSFDYVFFNRPHITIKFLDDVKKYCNNAKFIYYGHDLHYVRIHREYLLKNDEALLAESNKWKKIEYDIFNKVDLIYYPSIIEKQEILKHNSNYNVEVLQPYLYSKLKYKNYDPKNRDGILFVGGFRHSPNFDGIMWFINDIMPNLINKEPNIKLYIAGSYPPQELIDKTSKNIIVKGFVSDDELNELYNSVRLVIVPLRYGAGIKGKVIEAMSNNVPIITTECGAEGVDCNGIVIDNTMESLLEYYNDYNRLTNDSKLEHQYIMNEYTDESAKIKLKLQLENLK